MRKFKVLIANNEFVFFDINQAKEKFDNAKLNGIEANVWEYKNPNKNLVITNRIHVDSSLDYKKRNLPTPKLFGWS